ncbi:conserved hypothetical protein [Staphylothermus marinus F1]|uniref:Uncharacterized protein n=1 Tax=Staphylothermus marinus (strain ATCC 43588 / DSM 3639 / JCM 9404 / F1) TaxID=399550 RepID=A3DN66_STAMF|nr:hypothetical protein [Staphylothermus marinus]ABN70076.1 conserved hypothetical protein [Staphylothermus marinus F1]
MFTVSVQLSSINAERLSENLPPKIQFNVNLALPASNPYRRNNQYLIPFTFTVSSMPPVVQIVLKGNAIVITTNKNELEKLEKDIRNKKIPPPIVQAVFTNMLAESILLTRSLGVPPPLPGLPQIQPMQSRDKIGQQPSTVI